MASQCGKGHRVSGNPNVLLITTDQQRFDTVGARAPEFLMTPHLDYLARSGVTFSGAYADCPMCVPSRASIMTGRTVFGHELTWNGSTSEVVKHSSSLPTCLRNAGYQTAAVGKMHFTPQRARHGFDEMILPDDYYREMARGGCADRPMAHGLGQNELYPGMSTVSEARTLTSWTADRCAEYIRFRRDPTLPFFLWCSFTKPHPPLDPPEPYYSMYRDCYIPVRVVGKWSEGGDCPEAFLRAREMTSFDLIPDWVIRSARVAYYGLVTQVDYSIGVLLSALEDAGILEETLIIFTSDHGEYLGDHYAGGKTFFHEPSAHVPFIVRPPKSSGEIVCGSVLDQPVTHADILPTLVAASGGVVPDSSEGFNLLSAIYGEKSHQRTFVEGCGRSPDAEFLAITDGRWKYIWYPEGEKEQLFDLDVDPYELEDLSGDSEYDLCKGQLREELIGRHTNRESRWLNGDRLISYPVRNECVNERRSSAWPGFHSVHYEGDVRH